MAHETANAQLCTYSLLNDIIFVNVHLAVKNTLQRFFRMSLYTPKSEAWR
jgi:hypothetical protein